MKTTLVPELFLSFIIHGVVMYFFLTLPISTLGTMSFDNIAVSLISTKSVKNNSTEARKDIASKEKNAENFTSRTQRLKKDNEVQPRKYKTGESQKTQSVPVSKPASVHTDKEILEKSALNLKTSKQNTANNAQQKQNTNAIALTELPKVNQHSSRGYMTEDVAASRLVKGNHAYLSVAPKVVKSGNPRLVKRSEKLKVLPAPKKVIKKLSVQTKLKNTKSLPVAGNAALSESPELPGQGNITQTAEISIPGVKETASVDKTQSQELMKHPVPSAKDEKIEKTDTLALTQKERKSTDSVAEKAAFDHPEVPYNENERILPKSESKDIVAQKAAQDDQSALNEVETAIQPQVREAEAVSSESDATSRKASSVSADAATNSIIDMENPIPVPETVSQSQKVKVGRPKVIEAKKGRFSLVPEGKSSEEKTIQESKANQTRSVAKAIKSSKSAEKTNSVTKAEQIRLGNEKAQSPLFKESVLEVEKREELTLSHEEINISLKAKKAKAEQRVQVSNKTDKDGEAEEEAVSREKRSEIKAGQIQETMRPLTLPEIKTLTILFTPELSNIKLPIQEMAIVLNENESFEQFPRMSSQPAPSPPIIFGEQLIYRGWDEFVPGAETSETPQEYETLPPELNENEDETALIAIAAPSSDSLAGLAEGENIIDTDNPQELIIGESMFITEVPIADTDVTYVNSTDVFDSMFTVMEDLLVAQKERTISEAESLEDNPPDLVREDTKIQVRKGNNSFVEEKIGDETAEEEETFPEKQNDTLIAKAQTAIADVTPIPEAPVKEDSIAEKRTSVTVVDKAQEKGSQVHEIVESKNETASSSIMHTADASEKKEEALTKIQNDMIITDDESTIVDTIQTSEAPNENPVVAEILTPEQNRTPSRRAYQLNIDTKLTLARTETKKQEKVVKNRGLVLPIDILNDIEAEVYIPAKDDEIAFVLERRPHPMQSGSTWAKGKAVDLEVTDRYGEPGAERVMIYVERAEKGVYTLKIKNNADRTLNLTVKFRLYRGRDAEKSFDLVGLVIKAHEEKNVKFLIPEAVFWDEKDYFSGEMESSGYITKFNSDTGLVWKEKK